MKKMKSPLNISLSSFRSDACFCLKLEKNVTRSKNSINPYFSISVLCFFAVCLVLFLVKTRSTSTVDPPALKSQKAEYPSDQKLLRHYQHSKNQPNS